MVSRCVNFHLTIPHTSHPKFKPLQQQLSCRTATPTTIRKQFHLQFTDTISRRCTIVRSMAPNNPIPSLQDDSFESDSNQDSDPDPTLTNDDLKPTTQSQRTFSGYEMASLWIGLVVGVPSYYLAGSLANLGMAWWQGIATVVVANLILLVPLILTGEPGARYGISFPVLARSSFGIKGAHVPTLLRALVGCGWYGIETWIGGEAIFILLPNSVKQSTMSQVVPWLGTSPIEFCCFIVFWVAQLAIVWNGMDGIRELERYSAPILIVLTSCLLIWAYVNSGGLGHMLSMKSKLSVSQFWSLFFPSLTANISFWAPLALNIPDFTRYAKSQKDQIIGQSGLPIFMGLFTFVGLAVTSSTMVIFGRVISNPIELLGEIGGVTTMILAITGISLATITTNIAANVVAPANALVNLSPSRFTFRKGALLTALLGIVFQPWRLLKSSESFVYTWLVGYSALLGPIGGILLADYYLSGLMLTPVLVSNTSLPLICSTARTRNKSLRGLKQFKCNNPSSLETIISSLSIVFPNARSTSDILLHLNREQQDTFFHMYKDGAYSSIHDLGQNTGNSITTHEISGSRSRSHWLKSPTIMPARMYQILS